MKSYELELTPLPLKSFAFNKETKTLSTFASDLGDWKVERLYSDACDVGIAIESHLTGKTKVFYLSKQENDLGGDLVACHFTPVNPLANVKEVVIFND